MSLKQLIENQTEWMIRMGCPSWLVEQAIQSSAMHCWEEAAMRGIPVDDIAQKFIETRRQLGGHDFILNIESHE